MSLHSEAELLQKTARYCAYRERAESEVVEKLKTLGATPYQVTNIIAKLKAENYFNATRFAAAFVRGKFNNNKWGRIKIKAELAAKGIDRKEIEKALKEINESDYLNTLKKLLDKKAKTIKDEAPAKARAKLMRYAYSKGFEADVVNRLLSLK